MEIGFDDITGKTLLAGFTYYDDNNDVVELVQKYGVVQRADKNGIVVMQDNGEKFYLPPDLRSTEKATPGKYKLKTTGETVKDPDFLCTWSVRKEINEQK